MKKAVSRVKFAIDKIRQNFFLKTNIMFAQSIMCRLNGKHQEVDL